MFDVVVPKLNNNDDSYMLLDWFVEDGQQVRQGDPLAELETSKALAELEADQDGIVHRLAIAQAQCRHGDVIARLFSTEENASARWPTSRRPHRVPAS